MTLQKLLESAFSLYQAGRFDEAAQACRKVLKSAPRNGDAHHLLGIIAHRLGRPAEAVEHVRRAVSANGRRAEYRNTLGVVERAAGQPDAAIASFRTALEIDPRHAQAAANLGNALAQTGKFSEAAESYRKALALAPNSPGIHNNLGNVLRELGQFDAAVESFEAALRLNPNYVEARTNLGVALVSAERYGDAVAAYRQALAVDPDHLPALANIGNALLIMGENDEARVAYQRALVIKPDFQEIHLNHVALQNYLDDATAARTLSLARRYGEGLLAGSGAPFANARDPVKRLRVGLVSGDLRSHSVARFLAPVLAAHDPEALEFVAYSTSTLADDTTAELKQSIGTWRMIKGMPAPAAAALVRGDGVDILIDLSGYTDGARLDLFAQKPAPVQLGWLGYSGTTGVPGMDYILADQWVAPPGSEAEFSETVLRMPDSYLCFGTPDWPEPGDLPARRKGHITFGCFNNIAKVGERTVQCWIDVLKAVPDSRLILKSSKGGVQKRLDELEALFVSAGIDPSRLHLIDRVPGRAAHLALYDEIDIGLDPFPYNGTTTTCEALWMSVPVLTMRGDSFVSRVGESLMQSMDLPEWVATDRADYVARAAQFAGDLDALATLRSSLRERLAASPLGDATRFARNFEAAMQQMWVRWCEGTQA
jgi:protein O-GlcNAc transferase